MPLEEETSLGQEKTSLERVNRTSRRVAILALLATPFAFAQGCATFGSFHKSDPAVDERAAQKVAGEALAELDRLSALHKERKISVCFLGVTGGSNAASLSSTTRERLESGDFKLFDKSVVQDALKESGVQPNNIFIPNQRKKFTDALGEPVDYIMAGYVEKDLVDPEDEKSAKKNVYRLSLVEVETNKKVEFVADL